MHYSLMNSLRLNCSLRRRSPLQSDQTVLRHPSLLTADSMKQQKPYVPFSIWSPTKCNRRRPNSCSIALGKKHGTKVPRNSKSAYREVSHSTKQQTEPQRSYLKSFRASYSHRESRRDQVEILKWEIDLRQSGRRRAGILLCLQTVRSTTCHYHSSVSSFEVSSFILVVVYRIKKVWDLIELSSLSFCQNTSLELGFQLAWLGCCSIFAVRNRTIIGFLHFVFASAFQCFNLFRICKSQYFC